MQHILFLGRNGFFKRDFQRFQIDKLSKKFKVNFLDLSNLCNKKFYQKEKSNFFKTKKLIKVNSIKNFKKFLKKNKINCVLDISNPDSQMLNIFRRIINENNIKLVNFQTSLYPVFKRSFFLKIKYFLKILFFNQNLLSYYIKKLSRLKISTKKKQVSFFYDYIFCIGREGIISDNVKNKKTQHIFANSLDYEINKKYFKKIKKENFMLFLDQYLPYHNAYVHREIPPFVTPEKYYKSLNIFFEFLEKNFKTRVIVSAHPRSNYKNLENLFSNREIINYKRTNEFVSRSLAVINYSSTALSFAVIHKKPIIFYTSNEINNSHDAYYVNFLSNQLGSTVCNIDNTFSLKKNKNLLKINKYKYKDYLNKYICHFKSEKNSNINKIIKIINEN